MALILAQEYLNNRDSDAGIRLNVNADTTSRENVNARKGKGPPRSQLTEGTLVQIRGFKIRSDGVQGLAVPLSRALQEGCFSP